MDFILLQRSGQIMKIQNLYGFGGCHEKSAEYSSGVGSNIYSGYSPVGSDNHRIYYKIMNLSPGPDATNKSMEFLILFQWLAF